MERWIRILMTPGVWADCLVLEDTTVEGTHIQMLSGIVFHPKTLKPFALINADLRGVQYRDIPAPDGGAADGFEMTRENLLWDWSELPPVNLAHFEMGR